METSQIILSVMVAFIAALPGIVALIAQRKKTNAEAENFESQSDKLRVESGDIIRKAAQEMTFQYKERVKELETSVLTLNVRINDLQESLRDAYTEIKRLNEALKVANKKLSE
jgi:peptidoglycan hydrolase CwlO-like protein